LGEEELLYLYEIGWRDILATPAEEAWANKTWKGNGILIWCKGRRRLGSKGMIAASKRPEDFPELKVTTKAREEWHAKMTTAAKDGRRGS
jgi:hypothetical protein